MSIWSGAYFIGFQHEIALPGDNLENKLKALVEKEDSHPDKLESEIKVNSATNKCASDSPSVTPSKKDKSDRHSRQSNWKDYPWNSSNERNKKERGNKVKERILGCSTINELIKLNSAGKISDREIDWLKDNALSVAERKQIEDIEATRQGNLFNEVDCGEIVQEERVQEQFDFDEVMKETDAEMLRLNWSRGEGKDYLLKTYGVKSRHRLNDEQLIEFWNYLKQQ